MARGLERLLQQARGLAELITSVFSRVEGISISGLSVSISRRKPSIILEVASALDRLAEELGENAVLVFDEAQEFTIVPGFAKMLAHIYDYVDRVKVVLAGSEVGLLDRLLGRNNPRAPLYGRAFLEIEMRRLDREKAMDFLRRGFSELGIEWPSQYIEEAVASLGGIPGWLTSYGYYSYVYRDHEKALGRVIEEGAGLVRSEIERFLANRAPARTRYITILKCLSTRPMRWSELKTCLETGIARAMNRSQFTRYLRELRAYGFVEKEGEYYTLADPLIRYSLTR